MAELCRKYGISAATFYKWRSKYGGLEVSEAKRLRSLEVENAKLKRLVAEMELEMIRTQLEGSWGEGVDQPSTANPRLPLPNTTVVVFNPLAIRLRR